MEKEPIQYTPNMFFQCYIVDRLDFWEGFAEKMQELGFEMDCCKSFEEYRIKRPLPARIFMIKISNSRASPQHCTSTFMGRSSFLFLVSFSGCKITTIP